MAFIASEIVIVQWYFFRQQPEIARQELAIVIFAGVVGALLDVSLSRRCQFGLVSILGATLVLSHYSTAYVTIVLCVMTGIFATLMTRIHRETLAPSPWFAAAAVISVAAAIWYIPITHSDDNLTYVAQSLKRSGLQLLPRTRRGENVIEVYFNGLREPPPTASQYQVAIAHYYAIHDPFLVPLPVAHESRFDLPAALGFSAPGPFPSMAQVLSDAELLVQQLMDGLGVLGVLVIAFRRRSRPFSRTVGLAGLGALIILAASRLSGTLADDYNSSRLYLQCLFLLAPIEAALVDHIARRLREHLWPRIQRHARALYPRSQAILPWLRVDPLWLYGLMLVVALFGNSGLGVIAVGGDPPVSLSNSGEDYARFFVSPQEAETAQWLARAVPASRVIYADDYGQLILAEFTQLHRGIFNDITPLTIDQHTWVFGSTQNVKGDRTWGVTSRGSLDIIFPTSFLDEYFNIVFSTGSTEVFHR